MYKLSTSIADPAKISRADEPGIGIVELVEANKTDNPDTSIVGEDS